MSGPMRPPQWNAPPNGQPGGFPPSNFGIRPPLPPGSNPAGPLHGPSMGVPPGPPHYQPTHQYAPPLPGGAAMPPLIRPPFSSAAPSTPPMVNTPAAGGPPPTMHGVPSGNALSASNELLPAPYHGKGIYSHTTHVGPPLSTSITPTNSEPASLDNSRVPSPIPSQQFDALEGQFQPGTPTSNRNTPPSGSPIPHAMPSSRGGMRPPFPPVSGSPQMNGPGHPPIFNSNLPNQNVMGRQPPPTMNQPPLPGNAHSFQQPPAAGNPPQFPPPPVSGATQFQQPPIPGSPQQFPPQFRSGAPNLPGVSQPAMPPIGQFPTQTNQFGPGAVPPVGAAVPGSMHGMSQQFGAMSMQHQPPVELRTFNLLQERNILPAESVQPPMPNIPDHLKKNNCSPDIFRCTLTAVPQSSSLLQKARLPLGILIHPFKDLSLDDSSLYSSSDDSLLTDDCTITTTATTTPPLQSSSQSYHYPNLPTTLTRSHNLPVIQSSVIVRCRSCRTYINPFVSFIDQRRWRCNLCFRANELPEEFNFDPVTKSYGSPERRPEIKSSTIEFVAPSEYMLRPPQPCVYLFLLDVSYNALQTGYLQSFCEVLSDELDKLPGDARTMIGFISYNSSVHFYNLHEDLSMPQILSVSDVDDIFLPLPDGLLANLNSSKDLIEQLLERLPTYHQDDTFRDDRSAMGAAMQAGLKMLAPTGGRIAVVQTSLPNHGPGKLQSREDPNQRASSKPVNLQPATDFYKVLSLEAAGQQIALDLFLLNHQYADHSTIGGAARHSGGSIYTYPGLHVMHNSAEVERFEGDLKRYLTRKIGLEAVMRVRCTKGLGLHSFHGNFFVRSTDLLSLPNINPDSGFGMQVTIDDNLTESPYACLQAALLYTSSKGERRIRVHTLCLPVSTSLTDIINGADQQAIACLLAKMAVDRSINSSVTDAREALVNACTDALAAYGGTLSSQQRMGALPSPYSLRLLPLYVSSILKLAAFRLGVSTKADDRSDSMDCCKALPLFRLLQKIVPDLYPVHALTEEGALLREDITIPQPPRLQLSSGSIDRHGAFLLDVGDYLYLWIGSTIHPEFCQNVFERPDSNSLPEGLIELPELDNPVSENIRAFVSYIQDCKPNYPPLILIKETGANRHIFMQYMVEDKTQSSMSYYEFLQHIQKQLKS